MIPKSRVGLSGVPSSHSWSHCYWGCAVPVLPPPPQHQALTLAQSLDHSQGAPGLCRAGSGVRWKTKMRHQVYLGQDSAYLPPGQCPCSWLSPMGSTLGHGTKPSSHSQTCWGQQVSPCLEKPHLGHPKPISCSEGSHSACCCPAPALCSTPRAGLRLPSPGKSMVVSSSGDSSRLRMDCWKVLLQLDCRWL